MTKIDCDIIQDLIPSYVDQVCSDASRQCVEEHLAICEKCKNTVELYSSHDFSTEAIDNKTLDGYKMVKAKIKQQNIVSYGFLLILTAFGLYTFLSDTNHIHAMFYYALFSICLMGTYFLSVPPKTWLRIGKKELILAGISIITSSYGAFLIYYCISSVLIGKLPFGIATQKIGPFLHTQWGFLFLLQLLIYGYMLVKLIKTNVDSRWILCLNLTGIFLLLSYVTLLAKIDSYENFTFRHDFIQMTANIVILGMIGIIFYLYRTFQDRRKNRT